jgi:hypothetical protein
MSTFGITDMSKEESLYPSILCVKEGIDLITTKVTVYNDPSQHNDVGALIDVNFGERLVPDLMHE